MKYILLFGFFLMSIHLIAQSKKAEDYGYKLLHTIYKGDTVDMLLKSKKGEENKKKPLFIFCQGSLPVPLIMYNGEHLYSVFPFNTDSLEINFHLVIISKPFVPIIMDATKLNSSFMYLDSNTNKIPKKYSDRNFLDYYVDRDLKVIEYLQKLPFIDNSKLVVAGHSEGSTVAAKLASKSKKITHLIYSSGCPFGRIMAMIGKNRDMETDTDSTRFTENNFEYWKEVVNNKNDLDDSKGDTYKATYDFSIPSIKYLEQLKIPVLICYGTKDWSAPFNDYLRVEMIRQHKKNFTFKSYIGLEHNFYPINSSGKPNYDIFNWDKIGLDWWKWIK